MNVREMTQDEYIKRLWGEIPMTEEENEEFDNQSSELFDEQLRNSKPLGKPIVLSDEKRVDIVNSINGG